MQCKMEIHAVRGGNTHSEIWQYMQCSAPSCMQCTLLHAVHPPASPCPPYCGGGSGTISPAPFAWGSLVSSSVTTVVALGPSHWPPLLGGLQCHLQLLLWWLWDHLTGPLCLGVFTVILRWWLWDHLSSPEQVSALIPDLYGYSMAIVWL